MKKSSVFVVFVLGFAIGIFYFVSAKDELSLASNNDNSQLKTLNQKTESGVALQGQEDDQAVDQIEADNVEFISNSNELDEELLDWYFSMPIFDPDKHHLSDDDSEIKQFISKMKEDPKAFIRLATSGLDNPYLIWALFDIPNEQLVLLLPFIDENHDIADIAFQRKLHKTHPEAFSNALYDWSKDMELLPVGLVEAAIDNNNKAALGIILDAAVHSPRGSRIFKALASSELKGETTLLAEEIWGNFDRSSSINDQIDKAYIAAKYTGNHEAIMELARLFEINNGWEEEYFRWLIDDLILHNGVKINFHEDAEGLEYDLTGRKRWSLPS